ncbi:hypothetical protein [Providencia rettgeri]|uniref:hypothetical protein n=1 Tax=Providencia rettgeri TaxID=587 RepID=UPI002F2B2446
MGLWLHAQHTAQRGVLLFGERIVNAVFAFTNGKNTWNIPRRNDTALCQSYPRAAF